MLFTLTAALSLATAQAAPIVVHDPADRVSFYQRGIVWQRPAWISTNFEFSPELDLQKGPAQTGDFSRVHSDEISCLTTIGDLDTGDTRGSAKFKCQLVKEDPVTGAAIPLRDRNGKREMIKVKYMQATKENAEVYGEVFGTRLMWALGFAADQMYPMEKVRCFGCAPDPFVDRVIDPDTLLRPRSFFRNAVEVKYPGHEINFIYHNEKTNTSSPVSGWTFATLMKLLPTDLVERTEALKHRDALRLLMILIQHADNKSVNQKVVCPEKDVVDGECKGRAIFYVHDIGTILGVTDDWKKLDYQRWIRDSIWKDPQSCTAWINFPGMADPSFENAVISESGREFLVKLLNGFAGGAPGRARLRSLFLAARIDKRGRPETVDMWIDAFLAKVEEVQFPMGKSAQDFYCPQH